MCHDYIARLGTLVGPFETRKCPHLIYLSVLSSQLSLHEPALDVIDPKAFCYPQRSEGSVDIICTLPTTFLTL